MRDLANSDPSPWDRSRRRGKPQVTPYTQRATEVYLHRRLGVLPRETLGQGMGPLTARAAHVLRLLADVFVLHQNVLEVYPKATLALLRLGERHKKRVDERLRALTVLPDLSFGPGVWRESCVQSDHAFDAVICAYTGYRAQRDGWSVPPELTAVAEMDGWIWSPPARLGEAVKPETLEPQRSAEPTVRRASDG
jgi:predicted nuclease with RNAse H fold